MSILIPSSPKRVQKLPSAPLSPKQNVLKREMELNQAESAVLRNANAQLEIETNTLRKQLKYLKKSIQFESSQIAQIQSAEEKKLGNKLAELDNDYNNQVETIKNERKQMREEKISDLNNQIKDFNDFKQSVYSTIDESSKQMKEFISSARKQIIDKINSKDQ